MGFFSPALLLPNMLRWAKLRAPRLSDHRCVAVHDRLLLVGGFSNTASTGLRLHEADRAAAVAPADRSGRGSAWRALPPGAPADRGGHAVAVLCDTVLVHGGYGHGSVEGNLGDLWQRRPAADGTAAWSLLEPSSGVSPEARSGHTLSSLAPLDAEGHSCAAAELVLTCGFGQQALDDVHILALSPADNGAASWLRPRVVGPSPGPRCAHSAIATRCGGVVVFGGYSADGADAALCILEVATARAALETAQHGERSVIWTPLHAEPPPPLADDDKDEDEDDEGVFDLLPRSGHSAVLTSDDRMIVIGGTRSDGPQGASTLGDVLSLDVSAEGLERARRPDGGARCCI